MYKYKTLLTVIAFVSALSLKAQSVPKLKFIQPKLISGINGQKNATYKFSNVTSGIDAFVQIENIYGGAVLVNIDDSTLGYYDAWQPTVGGPDTLGSYSYIKWSIEFKTSEGSIYSFPNFDASSIDVDGDNARVREFVRVNGQSSYDIPTQVPSVLQISDVLSTDNANGDDANATDVYALGPVSNRTGIDTFSLDVRINYHFTNVSKIKFYTGSQIDNNGNTGAIATDRYHCIYFHNVKNNLFSVLPVTSQAFSVHEKNDQVTLTWATDPQKPYDHIEIERSFDQKKFKKISDVELSRNIKEYSYTDASFELKNNNDIFYRLKFVAREGEFFYSDVKTVKIKEFGNTTIRISPNPYMEKLNVHFESGENNKAEVRLINMNGNVIAYQQAKVNKGSNTIELKDLKSKAAGMYLVTVSLDGQMISSQKVLKN